MKDQFSQVARRTRRYKFDNGTTELMLGGLLFWGSISLMVKSQVLAAILFIVGVLLVALGVDALQRKYVYPRAGYVEFREATRRGIWKPLLAGLASMLVFFAAFWLILALDPERVIGWITPLLGLFLGLVFLYIALAFRFWRLAVVSLVSFGVGMLLSPIVVPAGTPGGYAGSGAMAFFFVVVGLALLVSGGLAFRAFLRQNPVEKEEQV